MPTNRKQVVAVELTANTAKLDRDMKRAVNIVRKRSKEAQRELNKVQAATTGKRGMGAGAMMGAGMKRAKGLAMGAMAFGGFYGLQNEVRALKNFKSGLVDVAVVGNKNKSWVVATEKAMLANSDAMGIAKEAYLDYVKVMVKATGNVDLAVGTMGKMGAVAKAAKVDMGALAAINVELINKAGIAAKDLTGVYDVLASQAQMGAVELEDMASRFPMVLNLMTQFQHKGKKAVAEYGALFQMAKRGNTSVEETATSMTRFMQQIIAKRADLEKTLNIKLKKNGAWLELGEMLPLIFNRLVDIEKKGGKVIKKGRGGKRSKMDVESFMLEMFDVRGVKTATQMLAQARVGFGGNVGAGESWKKLAYGTEGGAIDKMLARRRALNPFEGFQKSMNRFRNTMHRELTPVIIELTKHLPKAAKALMFLIKNWKMLLGIWVSHKMTQFFMQMAQAGKGVRSGAGGFGGGGWGGRGGGGRGRKPKKGGKLGKLGAAGGIVGQFAEGYLIGNMLTNWVGETFTSGASKWSQALSDDEKWNKEIDAQVKAESKERKGAAGYRIFKKHRKKFAGTEKGKAQILAGKTSAEMLRIAIQSGDPALIQAAQAMAGTAAADLSKSERAMVESKQYGGNVARRKELFGSMSGAQKHYINPEVRELISALKVSTQVLKELDLQRQVEVAAAKALVVLTTASRSGGKR